VILYEQQRSATRHEGNIAAIPAHLHLVVDAPLEEWGMATTHPTIDTRTKVSEDLSATTPAPSVALGVIRILLGFVFLWSFLDKTFGLYATSPEESWLAGESPTSGYLGSLEGSFADVFQAMAGQAWVDWMFMLGMGLVGTALILGVAMRLAAVGAVALMGSLYLTSIPLENNPLVDEHLMYGTLAVVLAVVGAGHALGAGRAWARLPIVRWSPWLR
jgi:thiosulfate dehydrogenase (quinone) large subunit